MKTYYNEELGLDLPERREFPRGERNEELESIFNGFHNVIDNTFDRYHQGYLQAMMVALARLYRELANAQR